MRRESAHLPCELVPEGLPVAAAHAAEVLPVHGCAPLKTRSATLLQAPAECCGAPSSPRSTGPRRGAWKPGSRRSPLATDPAAKLLWRSRTGPGNADPSPVPLAPLLIPFCTA